MIHMDDMLVFITQDDVVIRRVFIQDIVPACPTSALHQSRMNGKMKYYAVSRQMVLFAVERRKAWRMLQSKAGVVNKDYLAQKALLKKLDAGQVPLADVQSKTRELYEAELARLK